MGTIFDCFRGSSTEQTQQSNDVNNVFTPDTVILFNNIDQNLNNKEIIFQENRRQAAAEAANRRLQQNEKRGVDEDELRRIKQRQSELERIEKQQAKLPKQTGGNNDGLRVSENIIFFLI